MNGSAGLKVMMRCGTPDPLKWWSGRSSAANT